LSGVATADNLASEPISPESTPAVSIEERTMNKKKRKSLSDGASTTDNLASEKSSKKRRRDSEVNQETDQHALRSGEVKTKKKKRKEQVSHE
jgi:hypothetical protein